VHGAYVVTDGAYFLLLTVAVVQSAAAVGEQPTPSAEEDTSADAVPPAELIVQLEAHLQHCEQRIAAGKVAAANAEASLKVEKDVLAAVVKVGSIIEPNDLFRTDTPH
jgi:glutamine synthetase type III